MHGDDGAEDGAGVGAMVGAEDGAGVGAMDGAGDGPACDPTPDQSYMQWELKNEIEL